MKKNRLITPDTFSFNLVLQALTLEQRELALQSKIKFKTQLLGQPLKNERSTAIMTKIIQIMQEMKNAKKKKLIPNVYTYNFILNAFSLVAQQGDKYAAAKSLELLKEMKLNVSNQIFPDKISYGCVMSSFLISAKSGDEGSIGVIEVSIFISTFILFYFLILFCI